MGGDSGWCAGGSGEGTQLKEALPFLGYPRSLRPHRSWRAPWPHCEYPSVPALNLTASPSVISQWVPWQLPFQQA